MWFEDDELFGKRRATKRRKGTRRKKSFLKVNARLSSRKNQKFYRMGAIALVVAGIICIGLLLWYGIGFFGRSMFSENDQFAITEYDIRCESESVLTEARVRSYMELGTNANLFAIDITEVRKKLEDNPSISSAEVRRRFPGTLVVRVWERVPVAWIYKRRALAMDEDGIILFLKSAHHELPVITGISPRGLRPGKKIEERGLHALSVLNLCDKTDIGLSITVKGIDVSPEGCLRSGSIRLYLESSDTVLLWWKRDPAGSEAAEKDLQERLEYLVKTQLPAIRRESGPVEIPLELDNYKDNTVARSQPR